MTDKDKDARLAAALRDNLRKRKAGAQASSPAKAGVQCSSDEEK